MQVASQQYKQDMKALKRNHSYMRVSIGVINQMAQADCRVRSVDELTYFSNATLPLNNYSVDGLYATYEENYTKANGEKYFLPRDPNNVVFNSGIIAKDIGDAITFVFSKEYDIRGLTIDFGEEYPVDFRIKTNEKELEISGNTNTKLEINEIFTNTIWITIVPVKMLSGQCRLRIHQITMGVGICFDNRTIVSSEKIEYISPISEELPTIDFNLKVDNYDKRFNVDNDSSVVNFLENGQEVDVMYGYELNNGTTEWIAGTNLLLKEWDADDVVMNFTAIDRICGLESTYYGGIFSPSGMSLYDLAEDVLIDAGMESREYQLDAYLKTVLIKNPIPVVRHKEALQLIANAGRCILYQNRQGVICIKAAFNITLSPRLTASSDNATKFSNTRSIVTTTQRGRYATYESDSITAEGNSYFLPRNGNYINTGYVSQSISDNSGSFLVHPIVRVSLEAAVKYYGLYLFFSGNPPKQFILHTYKEGVLQESYTVVSGITRETFVEHEFPEADQYVIEFTQAMPYNRVSLDHVDFGETTDYALEYSTDLFKTPKGRKLEPVKEIRVLSTSYKEGTEEKELFKEHILITKEIYTVYFSNASHGFSTSAGTIRSYSAFYVTIDFHGIPDGTEIDLTITGYEYIQSENYHIKSIYDNGVIEEWSNPLVDDAIVADVAGWLGDYFYSNREYELSYRGEPRIDGNDVLFLESNYVENLKVRVYEHRLKFDQTLSGSIRARRDMYVDRTKNKLVRDRLY